MQLKRPLVTGVLFLVILSAYGQRNRVNDLDTENFFRIGAKAGTNLNKLPGKSFKQFAYNYQLGGFLQFNFSRRFGIQPEVNITQAASTYTDDVTEVYDDLARVGEQRSQKFNYMEVPLLLNINVGESRHVKLQIGPAFGTSLSKPVIDTIKNKGTTYLFKNGEFSAIGGLWIQVPFFNVGARYKLGLSNVHQEGEKWRNQAIQVFLGFTF